MSEVVLYQRKPNDTKFLDRYKIPYSDKSITYNMSKDSLIMTLRELQNDLRNVVEVLQGDGKEWQPIRHAHWKRIPWQPKNGTIRKCTNCDAEFIGTDKFKYCPNCGAKMGGNI